MNPPKNCGCDVCNGVEEFLRRLGASGYMAGRYLSRDGDEVLVVRDKPEDLSSCELAKKTFCEFAKNHLLSSQLKFRKHFPSVFDIEDLAKSVAIFIRHYEGSLWIHERCVLDFHLSIYYPEKRRTGWEAIGTLAACHGAVVPKQKFVCLHIHQLFNEAEDIYDIGII